MEYQYYLAHPGKSVSVVCVVRCDVESLSWEWCQQMEKQEVWWTSISHRPEMLLSRAYLSMEDLLDSETKNHPFLETYI